MKNEGQYWRAIWSKNGSNTSAILGFGMKLTNAASFWGKEANEQTQSKHVSTMLQHPRQPCRVSRSRTQKAFNMRVIVKKWGNSASVRIPASVMQAANLSLDETVDVREENGLIVIEPVRPSEYDLAQLLDGITKKNLHTEINFGQAVGKEML
jgi:antitoxin MazE